MNFSDCYLAVLCCVAFLAYIASVCNGNLAKDDSGRQCRVCTSSIAGEALGRAVLTTSGQLSEVH